MRHCKISSVEPDEAPFSQRLTTTVATSGSRLGSDVSPFARVVGIGAIRDGVRRAGRRAILAFGVLRRDAAQGRREVRGEPDGRPVVLLRAEDFAMRGEAPSDRARERGVVHRREYLVGLEREIEVGGAVISGHRRLIRRAGGGARVALLRHPGLPPRHPRRGRHSRFWDGSDPPKRQSPTRGARGFANPTPLS